MKNTLLTAPLSGGFKSKSSFAEVILQRIQKLLESGVSVEDIFLLFPSTRDMGFLSTLKITIAFMGMSKLFHVTRGESTQEEILEQKKKILIMTYHQSKGLERDHVFVFYFDSKFVEVFNKTYDYDTLTNEHYVALTRAKKGLYMISADAAYDAEGEKKAARLFHFMPRQGYDNVFYCFRSYKKEKDLAHNDILVQCFNDFILFMRRKYFDDNDFRGKLRSCKSLCAAMGTKGAREKNLRGARRVKTLFRKYLVAW